jgi:hypothetical protein
MSQLFYVSFARPTQPGEKTGWLGGAIVEAEEPTAAIHRCNEFLINPGGEAMVYACSQDIDAQYRNRLMGMKEMTAVFGPMRKVERNAGIVRVCQECNEGTCECHDLQR